MKLKVNQFNIDICIFIIAFFLQGFSIIKTNSFGISFSVTIVMYIAIKYKFIFEKCNLKFLLINIMIISSVLLSYIVNLIEIDILKIMRLEMILITIYFTYKYMRLIIKFDYLKLFNKYLITITNINCIYGLYQIYAVENELPLFMNIFRNNSSYNLSNVSLYSHTGGGWVENRIFTTFAEPSFYAQFLVIIFFIILFLNKNNINKKIILTSGLILTNLYLTYSRSGQMQFVYIVVILLLWKFISIVKSKYFVNIIYTIIILIPFLNISIMKYANEHIFNDLSSVARTESVLYYLNQTLSQIKYLIFGHGLGVMQNDFTAYLYNSSIEKFAHNGYVEIMYENGCIILIALIVIFISMLNNISSIQWRVIFLAIVVNLNTFASTYNIESIVILITILYSIIINVEKQTESNINNRIVGQNLKGISDIL